MFFCVRKIIPQIPKFPTILGNETITLKPTIVVIEKDILENTKKINQIMIKYTGKEIIDTKKFIKRYNEREDLIYNLMDHNKSNIIAINKNPNNEIKIDKNNAEILNNINFVPNLSFREIKFL